MQRASATVERVVKRTFWSIFVGAAAALIGPRPADVAPIHEIVHPVTEAVVAKRNEAPAVVRHEDDRDEDPAATHVAAEDAAARIAHPVVASLPRPAASPDLAPLSRRALGRPRVRAPDALA